MKNDDELIAALSSAPEGTHELGVAVLEALGAKSREGLFDESYWYIHDVDVCYCGDEARVVTDLNFRLPGVPEDRHEYWQIFGPHEGLWLAKLWHNDPDDHYLVAKGQARTEALARIVAQLKAVLAVKEKE